MTQTSEIDITTAAASIAARRAGILAEIRKVVVGQDEVIDQVLMAVFTGGHCLITGVPGLAKTLLIKTVAQILDLSFKRIQFTPDLMPADITGTEVLDDEAGHRVLRFVPGPIFAQIVLADEINRTPPKTQAALLEAMEERQVSIDGDTHPLRARGRGDGTDLTHDGCPLRAPEVVARLVGAAVPERRRHVPHRRQIVATDGALGEVRFQLAARVAHERPLGQIDERRPQPATHEGDHVGFLPSHAWRRRTAWW